MTLHSQFTINHRTDAANRNVWAAQAEADVARFNAGIRAKCDQNPSEPAYARALKAMVIEERKGHSAKKEEPTGAPNISREIIRLMRDCKERTVTDIQTALRNRGKSASIGYIEEIMPGLVKSRRLSTSTICDVRIYNGKRERKRSKDGRNGRPPIVQTATLNALKSGPMTARAIADATGHKISMISTTLSRQQNLGVVIGEKGDGIAKVWRLKEAANG